MSSGLGDGQHHGHKFDETVCGIRLRWLRSMANEVSDILVTNRLPNMSLMAGWAKVYDVVSHPNTKCVTSIDVIAWGTSST